MTKWVTKGQPNKVQLEDVISSKSIMSRIGPIPTKVHEESSPESTGRDGDKYTEKNSIYNHSL